MTYVLERTLVLFICMYCSSVLYVQYVQYIKVYYSIYQSRDQLNRFVFFTWDCQIPDQLPSYAGDQLIETTSIKIIHDFAGANYGRLT